MVAVLARDVKRLRDVTGAGMMDCKQALLEATGDFDQAIAVLRVKGLADAAKKQTRDTNEGLVHSYLHNPDPRSGLPPRVGVLIELSTETDFAAKTRDLRDLAQELALHIAATKPVYVTREEVPDEVLAVQRAAVLEKVAGKPVNVVEKAIEGAANKFIQENCLLEQKWVKNDKQHIREVISAVAARLGENIFVRRFARYEVAPSAEAVAASRRLLGLPPLRYPDEE